MDKTWLTNNGGTVTVTGGEGSSLSVNTKGSKNNETTYGLDLHNGNTEIKLSGDFEINAVNEVNNSTSNSRGIYAEIGKNHDMKTEITANSIQITATNADSKNYNNSAAIMTKDDWTDWSFNYENKNDVILTGKGDKNNIISATGQAIYSSYDKSTIQLTSNQASNKIYFAGNSAAFSAGVGAELGTIKITAKKDNIISILKNDDDSYQTGEYAIGAKQGNITLTASEGSNKISGARIGIISDDAFTAGRGTIDREITLTAGKDNSVSATEVAVDARSNYNFNIISNNGNNSFETTLYEISGDNRYVISADNAVVNITAHKNDGAQTYSGEVAGKNTVRAGKIVEKEVDGIKTLSGDYYALKTTGNNDDMKGEVNLTADTANLLYGAVSASENSAINIKGTKNLISSSKVINKKIDSTSIRYANAVEVTGNEELTGNDRTTVDITAANGGVNEIYSVGTSVSKYGERTVYATEGGVVNIAGTSIITADSWEKDNYQANNTSQALIAGTHDWGNTTPDFDVADEERSEINLIYGNATAVPLPVISPQAMPVRSILSTKAPAVVQ